MTEPVDGVEVSCHCGAVVMNLSHQPAEVIDCNCSLCRRYGVLWVYYEVSEISGLPVNDATHTYAWNGRHVDFHRCRTCGCVTHWAPRSDSRTQYGINARLLDPTLLSQAKLRHKDGAGSGKLLD
jgi:hypothetical protein